MDFTTFRNNLRNLIDSRGMSDKSFGEDIKIAPATISRYLSGHRMPDLAYVVRIAAYFNVSIDWLLGVSSDKFDVMPAEIQEVAHYYSIATPDDRRVVQAVLNKYRKE